MAKDTIINSAEISYEDKDTLVIQWQGNVGFGELTLKHTVGCNIEINAECMDIDTIKKVLLCLKK